MTAISTIPPELLPEDFINQMAETIKIIGHPQRLRILEFLDVYGESPVNQIIEGINGQQSAVSQHLNRLRQAGVLSCRRERNQVFYKIAAQNALTILNCMRHKYSEMNQASDCSE